MSDSAPEAEPVYVSIQHVGYITERVLYHDGGLHRVIVSAERADGLWEWRFPQSPNWNATKGIYEEVAYLNEEEFHHRTAEQRKVTLRGVATANSIPGGVFDSERTINGETSTITLKSIMSTERLDADGNGTGDILITEGFSWSEYHSPVYVPERNAVNDIEMKRVVRVNHLALNDPRYLAAKSELTDMNDCCATRAEYASLAKQLYEKAQALATEAERKAKIAYRDLWRLQVKLTAEHGAADLRGEDQTLRSVDSVDPIEPVTPEPAPVVLKETGMFELALAILRNRFAIEHIRPVPGEELRVIIGATVYQWSSITQRMHDHPRLSCSLDGNGELHWYWVAEDMAEGWSRRITTDRAVKLIKSVRAEQGEVIRGRLGLLPDEWERVAQALQQRTDIAWSLSAGGDLLWRWVGEPFTLPFRSYTGEILK